MMIRRFVLVVGFVGAVAACPKAEPVKSCESTDDCPSGWICLAKKCANPRASALIVNPGSAVTPVKVQKEVEQIQNKYMGGVDKMMQKTTEEPPPQ